MNTFIVDPQLNFRPNWQNADQFDSNYRACNCKPLNMNAYFGLTANSAGTL